MPDFSEVDAAKIAASLEADPRLLPYLGYLLQDLNSLGCDPELIVALARRASVREEPFSYTNCTTVFRSLRRGWTFELFTRVGSPGRMQARLRK